MATIRASNQLVLTGIYSTVDYWRWLASHWSRYPRPNIIINIKDIANISVNREILRLQGLNINTLIIIKGLDSRVDFSP